MNVTNALTALAICGMLSACGGAKTGGGTQSFAPTSAVLGLNFASNGVVSRSGSVWSNSQDDTVLDGQVPIRERGGIANPITVRAVTPNIYAVTSASRYASNFITGKTGYAYGRREAVDLPTAGTARMAGQYKGLIIERADALGQRVPEYITGNVSLIANFDRGIISGTMSNRRSVDADTNMEIGLPLNDLVFNETTLNGDATYVGNVSGGQYLSDTTNRNASSYRGVMGSTPSIGPRTAGILEVEHNRTGIGTILERGAFATDGAPVTP